MSIGHSDLFDYARFIDWLRDQEDKGVDDKAIIDTLLSYGTAVALYRAAAFALKQRYKDSSQMEEWLAEAYRCSDGDLNDLIGIFRVYYFVQVPQITDNRRISLESAIEAYRKYLNELNFKRVNNINLEGQYISLDGLIRIYKRLQNISEIRLLVPEILESVLKINSEILYQHTVIQLANAYALAGHYSEGLDLLIELELRQTILSNRELMFLNLNLAGLYLNLGNIKNSIISLEKRIPQKAATDLSIGYTQLVRLYYGLSYKEDIRIGTPSHIWHIDTLQNFSKADSLNPVGKNLLEREQNLREVLSISERSITRDTYETDLFFGYWVRVRARLILGEYGMAVQELNPSRFPGPEELYNRVLLAALDLELAMTPLDILRTPLLEAEERFRKVFEDARTIRHADPEGLAGLVIRWHPQAAAYAALMPQPVRECFPALDLIMRVSNRASWRGQAVPAPLVAHLTRLGLRVPTIGLSVGGNVAYQIARLGREENGVKIWGPVLPLLPMLAALARGGPDHLTIARRAWKDFGVLPTGNHNDPALADVVEVWRAVVDGQRPLADGLRALQDL